MRRRDMSLLFLSTATSAIGSHSIETPIDRARSNRRTVAELAADVTPVDLGYPEGDARRYGATTGSKDNSSSINCALLVSAHGGNAAFIPPGTWKIYGSLHCTASSSMYGAGQESVIAPQSCDGLIFEPQGSYCASRFFRDFQIAGNNTGTNNGLTINLPAESHGRITGVQFSNISIQNFAVGIFSRGTWNSCFRDCFLYNNFCGYHFHGQNVVNSIEGGFVQRASIKGAGRSYGVLVDSTDGESCQSLHMIAVGVYAYDVNICLDLALYTSIENCDISVALSIGVQLITVFGGTTIRDCWIQTNSPSATTGVQVADRGAPARDKIVIEACTFACNIANAGSVGIYVGSNQFAVTTNNNTIGTATNAFATGISNAGAHNHVAKFNTIYATAKAILLASLASNMEVGPNYVQNGTPIAFTAQTPPHLSFYANGTFTLELSGMSEAATGTVNWIANGRTIHLSLTDIPLVAASNSSTMTGIGLPSYLAPTLRRSVLAHVIDRNVRSHGEASINTDGSIVFTKDANGAAFTHSGMKGLAAATSIVYNI